MFGKSEVTYCSRERSTAYNLYGTSEAMQVTCYFIQRSKGVCSFLTNAQRKTAESKHIQPHFAEEPFPYFQQ